MTQPLASALFMDTWAGPVLATVQPFKTTRNGQRVTRYRWQRADGLHCCAAVYTSPEAAVAHKRRDARFADIRV